MARFRKVPLIIEAEQFFLGGEGLPQGVLVMCEPVGVHDGCSCDGAPHVHTLEGPLLVSDGDWIITGVKGERYPCKPDVFAMTYEPE